MYLHLEVMNDTAPILTTLMLTWQIIVQKSYTEFHGTPMKSSVADTR